MFLLLFCLQVEYIGICGQMHGVTMWNSSKKHQRRSKSFKLDIDRECVSHLYTWQDGRCDTAFLKSLPKSSSHLDVHSGYGCATLFWFARNKSVFLIDNSAQHYFNYQRRFSFFHTERTNSASTTSPARYKISLLGYFAIMTRLL